MFTLPSLDYNYDALEPHISKSIMELHHQKHHQTYVDKLNAALQAHAELQQKSIEELLQNLEELPDDIRLTVRNNGGGHYNHSLFWKVLTPNGSGQPNGSVAEKLLAKYESFETFQKQFSEAAAGVFGSGWAWLMPDMSITTSPNQDNPLMNGQPAPILGLDVWEHAYYLDYQNRRPDYITSWWHIINWPEVERRLAEG